MLGDQEKYFFFGETNITPDLVLTPGHNVRATPLDFIVVSLFMFLCSPFDVSLGT